MNKICVLALTAIAVVGTVVSAPLVSAEDGVTYEVVSDSIGAANVEYYDRSGRIALQQVPLPWRTTATVMDAVSPTRDGAEIRADWRGYGRWRYKYVTVRIYKGDHLLCESTLDVGDATCYGSTPHRNFPATGDGA
jgi:hypothetical protein